MTIDEAARAAAEAVYDAGLDCEDRRFREVVITHFAAIIARYMDAVSETSDEALRRSVIQASGLRDALNTAGAVLAVQSVLGGSRDCAKAADKCAAALRDAEGVGAAVFAELDGTRRQVECLEAQKP